MQEHQTNSNVPAVREPEPHSEFSSAWREVGTQFQHLGIRLGSAFRRSWSASGNQDASKATMRNLRDDLHEAADRIDRVIQDVSSETAEEREAALRATRQASEQSLEEARILTTATLRTLNRQLDHLVHRLEDDER